MMEIKPFVYHCVLEGSNSGTDVFLSFQHFLGQKCTIFFDSNKPISRYPPLLLMVSIEFFDENVQYNQNPAHTF